MLPARASACGKAILAGEHAVVYGFPALAVPLTALRARASFLPAVHGWEGLDMQLPDVSRFDIEPDAARHALARAAAVAFDHFGLPMPHAALAVESDVPPARGLGSGAAVAVAVIRAAAVAAGRELDDATASALAFEVEKIHHGNPSGIDNAVVALERPVLFRRAHGPRTLDTCALHLVFADSGGASKTRDMVEAVAARRQARPGEVDAVLQALGKAAMRCAGLAGAGDLAELGDELTRVHGLLRDLAVSTPALEALVDAALASGALGAKLSGAGGGGYMFALAPSAEAAPAIASALEAAGGTGVFTTRVGAAQSR